MVVEDGPKLEKGYYWYKLVSQDASIQGWAARNWLIRVGDIENGVYPLEDLAYHWSRDYVMKLLNQGFVNGDSETTFSPNKIVDREELSAFICKVLQLPEEEENEFVDIEEISPWALEYINKVCNAGLFKTEEGLFRPKKQVNRREAALILSRFFEDNEQNEEETINEEYDTDMELNFSDIEGLTEEEINGIKIVFKNNIMNGKSESLFCPHDYLTRAEVAVIMFRLLETMK